MAHQAHNIPWNTFASHFKFHFTDPDTSGYDKPSYMHATRKTNEFSEFNYFIEAFVLNLTAHSAAERKKYPEYAAPDPEDVLITDQVAHKIAPTVHKMKEYRAREWVTPRLNPGKMTPRLCPHRGGDAPDTSDCRCPLPFVERTAKAFMRTKEHNDCYHFWDENDEAFFNLEVIKILILYGEMDPVLRACHIPPTSYTDWYEAGECYDTDHDMGWNEVVQRALRAYILLNVLLCRPETWDPACGGRTDRTDYRRLADYQRTVKYLTKSGSGAETSTRPHRSFFGIRDRQFPECRVQRYGSGAQLMDRPFCCIPFGCVPYAEFLEFDARACGGPGKKEFLPQASDVTWVRCMLRSMGLPAELALDIMDLADYAPRRRLLVDHDPLHPDNREELGRYLTYCWLILVRCDMWVREMNVDGGWEKMWRNELTEAISHVAYDSLPHHSIHRHKKRNPDTYLSEGFEEDAATYRRR